jgi:hypothetical protein
MDIGFTGWNYKLVVAAGSGVIIMATLVIASCIIKEDNKDLAINLVVLVFGWSVGWLIGTFLSPYTGSEKTEFAEYAGAVSVFISGYAIGKVDRLITHVFDPTHFFGVSRITGFRLIVFSAALLTTMIITYNFRTYLLLPASKGT